VTVVWVRCRGSYRPRCRGHGVDGDREIAPPTEIVDPGAIVEPDFSPRTARVRARRPRRLGAFAYGRMTKSRSSSRAKRTWQK